jgi:TRAP-type C4-dicarboxylate transport system substrate-binding protein
MISRFLACLGGAAVALAASGAAAQEKWNLPTAYPDSNYHTKIIREMADEVKAATGGKLEIVVHSNASLFKMPEIKRAVQTEQVPIGEMLWNAYGNEDPLFEADAVPFLANSVPLARKLWDAAKPLIEERLKKQNLMVLYSAPWPPQGIYSKTPIAQMEDLKGVKFRTYSPLTARMAELMGAVPTTVQQAEVPQAFATGIVNAMITSPQTGVDTKAWEFLKHYYDTQAMYPKNVVIVNERALRRLAPDLQQALLAAAAKADAKGWAEMQAATAAQTKMLADNGIQVAPPAEKFLAQLREVGAKLTEDWLKKAGPDGQKIAAALK